MMRWTTPGHPTRCDGHRPAIKSSFRNRPRASLLACSLMYRNSKRSTPWTAC